MRCSKCGTEGISGKKFCAECGNPLSNRCSNCNSDNAPGAKFCADCGRELGKDVGVDGGKPFAARADGGVRIAPERQTSEAVEGERKTVTALFADIKGSTELMRDLDPEEARAIVDPALKLMIDAAHRYDGYVVQSTGDGIFALFGAPLAHEDHAQRALHAAIAMRDALRRSGEELKKQGWPGVEVRIGINTGEVVLRMVHTGGHTEYTPVGHAANLAARMQTVAPAGGIVISEDTRRLVEGYFELRDLGPTEVKGIGEPINVYEVVGAGPLRGHFELAARRGLTKFVGREREVAEMKRALRLVRGGHGQIIAAVAEAGTGKSRLVYEFKAALPPDCKVLEAYSVSHGKASAYLPVLELLYRYFGIGDADDKAARRTKIEMRLSALDPALSDTLPLLYTLLGLHEGADPLAQMDPQIKRRRMLDAIKRIILRESLNQPTVVIFEDLHWIDGETQTLLDLLADGIANSRILLLVNYRPEYRHEWTNKSYYTQLRLDALGRESAGEMLSTLLGDGAELDPLQRMVIERTEGNPFFIEEMVQALFDEGALVRNGVVKVARPVAQMRLPPTVQGVLASRIDRLPAEQKGLLQTLAVIGRESLLGLLGKVVSRTEAQLERMLGDLQAGEFTYEQPATGDIEYVFKHALTQEVAYNSLLIERRKLLHERIGDAIESLYASSLDDHLAELAHHYSHSDNVTKAIEYLGRAGQQALERSAYADAISSLGAAINLLQKLPESPERIRRELLVQLASSQALGVVKGWASPEVGRAFTRARELCELVGDPPEFFPALWGQWHVYLMRAELRTAYELAGQLLQRAERAHDPVLLLYAHESLGETSYYMGKFFAAREHFEAAISLYDPERTLDLRYSGFEFDAGVHALSTLAWNLWYLGYPDQALKKGNEGLALAQQLSHPYSLAVAEAFLAILHQFRREVRSAQETAEGAIALFAEHGSTADVFAVATTLHGWAMALQGRHEEGFEQLKEGLAAYRKGGAELGWFYLVSLLAAACLATGRLDEGLSALTPTLGSEMHRLKGELLLRQDSSNAAEARSCFERAVEMSRKQSAKSLELLATMSLARLLAKQGQRDEARTMLAEIYGWFTEGFDTADLKDAKALLDEVSS
jgi:class 3 adenylate cyclase/tetratricopeptide (TPR) repeat protein